ncbi:MAG: lysophospholipase [Gemmatimonadota bacterium]|nr:lysophospholipase [Gemmatimonadota bacterium]
MKPVLIAAGVGLLTLVRLSAAQEPPPADSSPMLRADTVPPPGVTETAFVFRSGALRLAGTLTEPRTAGRVPIAILVAGSGPTDRNGNSAAGLRTNTYAQLAWGLAERGVASLRYDKRVLPTAEGAVDMATLSFDDFADDVVGAAAAIRATDRYGKIVVAGHSEGAGLAIRAAARGLQADGLVLVAGAGRPMLQILHEQVGRQVDATALLAFDSAMARYVRGEPPGEVPQGLAALFVPAHQRFVSGLAAYDPTAELARVTVPVLIVQGETDIQIRPVDAERLRAARPDARLVLLPETNHVLKHATDTTLLAQLVTYRDPTLPVEPAAVEAIAAWVAALR